MQNDRLLIRNSYAINKINKQRRCFSEPIISPSSVTGLIGNTLNIRMYNRWLIVFNHGVGAALQLNYQRPPYTAAVASGSIGRALLFKEARQNYNTWS